MMYDIFHVLLDAICQYVAEDFSIYVHQQYWPEVFFFHYVFVWFWYLDDDGLTERLGVFPVFGFFGILSEA